MALSDLLTPQQIREWSGGPSFDRGQAYFEEGRVIGLEERRSGISAKVEGSYLYHVRLWEEGDSVAHSCDCPVGIRGEFCKHCVAAALTCLDGGSVFRSPDSGKPRKKKAAGTLANREDIYAWLLGHKKADLADMLMDLADYDKQLHERFEFKATTAKGADLSTYKKLINRAIGRSKFIDYHHAYDYWRRVDSGIDLIEDSLDAGQAEAVIELCEYSLVRVEKAIERVDDSDGYMGVLLRRLQDLHLDACDEAKPDGVKLAERLYKWERDGDWDTFYGAARTYAQVLGKAGLQRYQDLAEADWARIKPLKAGQDDSERYGKRHRITAIMECLAEQMGDIEALVAVKRRDLASAYRYLEIAEIYRQANQADKALEWAEEGVRVFGEECDSRLLDLLAGLYHDRNRHQDGMNLIWPQFARHPDLERYRKLKTHADRCASWPEWRTRALDHLRAVLRENAAKEKQAGWRLPYNRGNSRLVEIFLWEDDVEAAWREAQEGDCDDDLWLRLASLRENDHPQDSISVYCEAIGPIVDRTNNQAYSEAAGLVDKVERLMGKLGEQENFKHFLDEQRAKYKRKRNFMKLLEKY